MVKHMERARELYIIEEVDVVIIGGGPAGVAAAVNAAEEGLSTIIIEKNGFFGGANVGGYSATIGGLFNSTESGEPIQLVKGFAGRFVDIMESKGGLLRFERFGHTWLSPHDPFVWKETADELIEKAGVKTYFHTSFVDSIVEDEEIQGIIIENKDGRAVIKGQLYIDCSGDGDVAHRAGASSVFGKDGNIQSMTFTFRMTDVDWCKYGEYKLEDVWLKASEAANTGKYILPRKHPFIFRAPNKKQAIMNATSIVAKDGRTLYPTKTLDLTEAEFLGRKQVREYEKFVQDYIPGFENAYLMDTASQIGIRQSRTIICDYTLKNEDVVNAKKFDTAIARSAWPIEIHLGDKGVKVINLDEDYYEIPFEALIPKNVKNLLVAGRCISAEHEALASCRVVAQCFEEGAAVGLAALQIIRENKTTRTLSIVKLREKMREKGSLL